MFKFNFSCYNSDEANTGVNAFLKALYQPDEKYNANEYVKLLNNEIDGKIKISIDKNHPSVFSIEFSTDKADDNEDYNLFIELKPHSDYIFLNNREQALADLTFSLLKEINGCIKEDLFYLHREPVKDLNEVIFIKEYGFHKFAFKDEIVTLGEHDYCRYFYEVSTVLTEGRVELICDESGNFIKNEKINNKINTDIITIQDFYDGKVDKYGYEINFLGDE